MKRTIVSILFFWCIIVINTSAQEPIVVIDAKIIFFVPVRTDDKAADTQVSVTLYTSTGKRVATLDKCCGNIRFADDNFTSSTYHLDMRNTISKEEMQIGYFDVHIDPAAGDKWVFIPTLEIRFSDGTSAVVRGPADGATYTKREVSLQATDSTFPFHL
jgi:hypothetical protein